MKKSCSLVVVALGGLAMWAPHLQAQGYRVRVDTRFQSVAYRGVSLDSIAVTDTVTGTSGGLESPDGFAVRCAPGTGYCTFYRPAQVVRGGPVVSTVDFSTWGFGVPGLRVRAKARVGIEVGDENAWPGVDPALQLIEGYAEYARRLLSLQVGRTFSLSRLGYTGFDGASVELRPAGRVLRLTGYGGWGLARGVALPLTSAALNPLNEFRPANREFVAGGGLELSGRRIQARGWYQRAVNRQDDYLVSERVALDASIASNAGVVLSGGADYDLASGFWGTADAVLSYGSPRGRLSFSAGGRRYRPRFDLWTIWSAFSPVPYSAVFGSANVTPVSGVRLRGRAEVYGFDETETATPLVQVEDAGWRWSVGATYARLSAWTFDGTYHVETGPGAASLGIEGSATFRPNDALVVVAHASWMKRPLEFRFNDSRILSYAIRTDFRPVGAVRLYAEARRYDELRRRADAARLDWSQFRLNLGATLDFGSGAGVRGLHPAILRVPDRRR
jgi:hypothetical protein